MPATDTLQTVKAVRHFNRFYTAAIGTLQEGLLKSTLSLAEARILFELATAGRATLSELAAKLRLDMGYVSRILARFEERGWISRKPSATDARQSILSLTRSGQKQFVALDEQSNEQIAGMLSPLAPEQQRQLVQSMSRIEVLLASNGGAETPQRPFMLRGHRPGDMGWIIHRHGALYTQEYGWDGRFEALVARIAADFIDRYDATCERCWIAEREDNFLGCVFLVKDRTADKTAKLRLLLVEPTARGLGIGRMLVQQCRHFARQSSYSRIVLWTNSILTSARHIYEQEGYRLVQEEDHNSFGHKLTGQNWELQL
jgi:DNA-binding MarR family transcriptional regulator/GNAT superfamily N-acetyltransferase